MQVHSPGAVLGLSWKKTLGLPGSGAVLILKKNLARRRLKTWHPGLGAHLDLPRIAGRARNLAGV